MPSLLLPPQAMMPSSVCMDDTETIKDVRSTSSSEAEGGKAVVEPELLVEVPEVNDTASDQLELIDPEGEAAAVRTSLVQPNWCWQREGWRGGTMEGKAIRAF